MFMAQRIDRLLSNMYQSMARGRDSIVRNSGILKREAKRSIRGSPDSSNAPVRVMAADTHLEPIQLSFDFGVDSSRVEEKDGFLRVRKTLAQTAEKKRSREEGEEIESGVAQKMRPPSSEEIIRKIQKINQDTVKKITELSTVSRALSPVEMENVLRIIYQAALQISAFRDQAEWYLARGDAKCYDLITNTFSDMARSARSFEDLQDSYIRRQDEGIYRLRSIEQECKRLEAEAYERRKMVMAWMTQRALGYTPAGMMYQAAQSPYGVPQFPYGMAQSPYGVPQSPYGPYFPAGVGYNAASGTYPYPNTVEGVPPGYGYVASPLQKV